MKRYENMTSKEIIDTFAKSCNECVLHGKLCSDYTAKGYRRCVESQRAYLMGEVKQVRNADLYKTSEEAEQAFLEFCRKSDCLGCEYNVVKTGSNACHITFLYGTTEIEVEAGEEDV